MSETLCLELMYEILKYSDPYTYVQLIKTCWIMNKLGNPLKTRKIQESLRVIVEPHRTSYILPNKQLHGISQNNSWTNVQHLQEYSFGKLISESVDFSKVFGNSNMINFTSIDWKSYLYTKTYNYDKNQFVLKVTCGGNVCYEGEFLIATKEKHGTTKIYDKNSNISSFEIFNRNKLFYSESFLGNKIFQKVWQLDDNHYQVITYTGLKINSHLLTKEPRPISFFHNIKFTWFE
jgi:hypothetical protein